MAFGRLLKAMATVAVGVLAVAASFLPGSSAHGMLVAPVQRATDKTTSSCPHCLSSGGVGVVWAGGRNFPNGDHTVCGDPTTDRAPRMHEGGGKFSTLNGGLRMTYYPQGGRISFHVKLTANHWGYLQFSLCPLPSNLSKTSTTAENAVVTQKCFDQNVLQLAMPGGGPAKGNAYFLDGTRQSPFDIKVDGILPPGLTCERCVVQWHYVTANSCNPPGLPREWWGGGGGMSECGKNGGNPEEFWNCADIGVVPTGQTVPGPLNAKSMANMDNTVGGTTKGSGPGEAIGTINAGDKKVYDTASVNGGGDGAATGTGDTAGTAGVADTGTAGTSPVTRFPFMAVLVGLAGGTMTALPLLAASLPLAVAVGVVVSLAAGVAMYFIGKTGKSAYSGRYSGYAPLLAHALSIAFPQLGPYQPQPQHHPQFHQPQYPQHHSQYPQSQHVRARRRPRSHSGLDPDLELRLLALADMPSVPSVPRATKALPAGGREYARVLH